MALRVHDSGGGSSKVGATLSEINIIPLVDVILVLLLIFMLTAPLMNSGIDVNLPRSSAKAGPSEERLIVSLTKEQKIYINNSAIPLASLESRLRELVTSRTDKTVYLRADQGLPYGQVVDVMDRVRRAGVEKLGMVTEPVRER